MASETNWGQPTDTGLSGKWKFHWHVCVYVYVDWEHCSRSSLDRQTAGIPCMWIRCVLMKVWRCGAWSVCYNSCTDEGTCAADWGGGDQVWQPPRCTDGCSHRRHLTRGAGIQTAPGMWSM